MAKPELGTKRVCPVTGRKFYDLNKDPVVSPFTGQSYPRSFFDPLAKIAKVVPEKAEEEEEEDTEAAGAVEIVSLDEAAADDDGKEAASDDDIEIDADIDTDDDDTFLEEEEEDSDDVSGLIDGELPDEEDV